MVSNSAYHGKRSENPFYLKHYDLSFLAAFHNAIQYPGRAYQPDFGNNKYIREYLNVFSTANQIFGNPLYEVDRKKYKSGYTIFGFNFAPDLAEGCTYGHANMLNRGHIRIEARFAKPLPETINILIYSEFDNIVQIPFERNALVDYS